MEQADIQQFRRAYLVPSSTVAPAKNVRHWSGRLGVGVYGANGIAEAHQITGGKILGYEKRPGCNSSGVELIERLELLLVDARAALAAMNTDDASVTGLVVRVGSLRYAEGTLTGFLDALVLTDPVAARVVAPRIETFVSEAIAARLMLG